MKRFKHILAIYLLFFAWWGTWKSSYLSVSPNFSVRQEESLANSVSSNDYSDYSSSTLNEGNQAFWFVVFYKQRYWYVSKEGKIFDLYQEFCEDSHFRSIRSKSFVSGLRVIDESGEVDKKLLMFIPKDIPEVVFEINLQEKYIATTKSAIIYVTTLDDIIPCVSVLKTIGDYLDAGKIYLYRSRKLYSL